MKMETDSKGVKIEEEVDKYLQSLRGTSRLNDAGLKNVKVERKYEPSRCQNLGVTGHNQNKMLSGGVMVIMVGDSHCHCKCKTEKIVPGIILNDPDSAELLLKSETSFSEVRDIIANSENQISVIVKKDQLCGTDELLEESSLDESVGNDENDFSGLTNNLLDSPYKLLERPGTVTCDINQEHREIVQKLDIEPGGTTTEKMSVWERLEIGRKQKSEETAKWKELLDMGHSSDNNFPKEQGSPDPKATWESQENNDAALKNESIVDTLTGQPSQDPALIQMKAHSPIRLPARTSLDVSERLITIKPEFHKPNILISSEGGCHTSHGLPTFQHQLRNEHCRSRSPPKKMRRSPSPKRTRGSYRSRSPRISSRHRSPAKSEMRRRPSPEKYSPRRFRGSPRSRSMRRPYPRRPRDRSLSPRRRRKRSLSPRRRRKRSFSPRRHRQRSPSPRWRRERSRSPKRPHKRSYSPGSSRKRSHSPESSRKRSHSPGSSRKRSHSPESSRKRSHSGSYRKRSNSPGNSRKRSHSPGSSRKRSHTPTSLERSSRLWSSSPRRSHAGNYSPRRSCELSSPPKTYREVSSSPRTYRDGSFSMSDDSLTSILERTPSPTSSRYQYTSPRSFTPRKGRSFGRSSDF